MWKVVKVLWSQSTVCGCAPLLNKSGGFYVCCKMEEWLQNTTGLQSSLHRLCERAYLETPQSYAPYFLVHTFLAWETKEKCSNLWLYSNPPEAIKQKECVELQHKTGVNPAAENKTDVVRKPLTCSFCLFISTYFMLYVCRWLLNPLETGEW